jgi:ABC-2 type transport system ATP-binding protein
MAGELAVHVEGLEKRYGELRAVDGASFDVRAGEIYGVIGPNGSGKTTTIECVQGLRKYDKGVVEILGLNPRTAGRALRQKVGSQLQSSALPDRLKVWEALDLFASLSPRSRDWHDLVREWGLTEKRGAAFASLSGGQRQRLFVALALVNRPSIVFLDEMTTGLDPAARRVAWELVREVRARGTTVVLVTHFMDEAEALCDRVGVFRRGRVVAEDTPKGLVQRYHPSSTVHFTWEGGDASFLRAIPGVEAVDDTGAEVTVIGQGPLLSHVAVALANRGIEPLDLRVHLPTLEDVFLAAAEGAHP